MAHFALNDSLQIYIYIIYKGNLDKKPKQNIT